MEDQDSQTETVSLSSEKSNTKNLFKTFQELYTEQVKGTDESFDGLKSLSGNNAVEQELKSSRSSLELKVKVLENWVEDLTDQNVMLIKVVGELEGEALKKISLIEENLSQGPGPRTSPPYESSADKRIAYLCNDIWNLLELLRRLREDGFWYLDGLIFKTVSYEDIFGIPPWKCRCKNNVEKPHCWEVSISPSCSSGKGKPKCCCCNS